MTALADLWAIGFEGVERAAQIRDRITMLGEQQDIKLLDTAVVVRYPDGSVTLDGEPFIISDDKAHSRTIANILADIALAAPILNGAAAGALLRYTNTADVAATGISEEFIGEIERLMRPGTSALFVLDQEGNRDAVVHAIRGIGGTVLKTTVNPELAKLIQSILSAAPTDAARPRDR